MNIHNNTINNNISREPPNIYDDYQGQQKLFKNIAKQKQENSGGGDCLWYSLLQSGIFCNTINCPNEARNEAVVRILELYTKPRSYLKKLVNKKELDNYLTKINTPKNWTQGIDQIGYELIFYTLSGYYNTCIVLLINNGNMKISKVYNKYGRKRIFLLLSSEHYEFCNCNDDSFLQQIPIKNFDMIMP